MIQNQVKFTIGYFNIRGKAQVPRLLCQYYNIPYENKLYTPKQYLEEKKKNANLSLPILKQGKMNVFGPEQICFHILSSSNKQQTLGKSQQDKVRVKMYCWSIDSFASVIGMNSTKKPSSSQLEKQWQKNLKLKLKKYEKACLGRAEWFLGYLTLIDFSIYQLVRYMEWMFPGKMKIFQNLCNIKTKLSMLPQIKAYQNSKQCIKQMSPQRILQQLSNLMPQQVKKR